LAIGLARSMSRLWNRSKTQCPRKPRVESALLRYLTSRLMLTLPVLWLVVSVVFLLIHLVPGDPIQQMLGEGAASTDVVATRKAFGLDVPLGQQYINYWKGVIHLDLGKSLRFQRPVTSIIADAYPSTLLLTFAAMIVA